MIECHDLVKLYKSEQVEVFALQGLDLSIEKGECMAIVGKSGSGKSTLLNIIGGLEKPTAGKLFVKGQDLFAMSETELLDYRKHTVGFVWQNSARNLFPYLNVRENIMAVMDGKRKAEKRHRAEWLLQKVGLSEKAAAFPIQLSGGERQRVAIAVALANEPEILLADEPTGAVDQNTSVLIQQLFQTLAAELQVTVIIVTHDTGMADRVERVVMISDGKIGTEKVIRKNYEDNWKAARENGVFQDEVTQQEEYAVLDRAGRVQLPEHMRQEAGIETRKVHLFMEGERIIIEKETRG
mgnify:CR=1 FL=1